MTDVNALSLSAGTHEISAFDPSIYPVFGGRRVRFQSEPRGNLWWIQVLHRAQASEFANNPAFFEKTLTKTVELKLKKACGIIGELADEGGFSKDEEINKLIQNRLYAMLGSLYIWAFTDLKKVEELAQKIEGRKYGSHFTCTVYKLFPYAYTEESIPYLIRIITEGARASQHIRDSYLEGLSEHILERNLVGEFSYKEIEQAIELISPILSAIMEGYCLEGSDKNARSKNRYIRNVSEFIFRYLLERALNADAILEATQAALKVISWMRNEEEYRTFAATDLAQAAFKSVFPYFKKEENVLEFLKVINLCAGVLEENKQINKFNNWVYGDIAISLWTLLRDNPFPGQGLREILSLVRKFNDRRGVGAYTTLNEQSNLPLIIFKDLSWVMRTPETLKRAYNEAITFKVTLQTDDYRNWIYLPMARIFFNQGSRFAKEQEDIDALLEDTKKIASCAQDAPVDSIAEFAITVYRSLKSKPWIKNEDAKATAEALIVKYAQAEDKEIVQSLFEHALSNKRRREEEPKAPLPVVRFVDWENNNLQTEAMVLSQKHKDKSEFLKAAEKYKKDYEPKCINPRSLVVFAEICASEFTTKLFEEHNVHHYLDLLGARLGMVWGGGKFREEKVQLPPKPCNRELWHI